MLWKMWNVKVKGERDCCIHCEPYNACCPQNGQIYIKNLGAFAARFLTYIWSFCGDQVR